MSMKVTKEQFIGVTYDELLAENARLREQVDAAHMSRLLTENENEKLWELVQDLREHIESDDGFGPDIGWMLDRMHELGVEVDDA